ncbi:hypothetical protein BC829DRAFT_447002 [Chytridium lagenaria]|nr:hypothetical protein BC829DRAFT_447002 [Chytridium lagenaria]
MAAAASIASSSSGDSSEKYRLPLLTSHSSEAARVHWSRQIKLLLTARGLKGWLTATPDVARAEEVMADAQACLLITGYIEDEFAVTIYSRTGKNNPTLRDIWTALGLTATSSLLVDFTPLLFCFLSMRFTPARDNPILEEFENFYAICLPVSTVVPATLATTNVPASKKTKTCNTCGRKGHLTNAASEPHPVISVVLYLDIGARIAPPDLRACLYSSCNGQPCNQLNLH